MRTKSARESQFCAKSIRSVCRERLRPARLNKLLRQLGPARRRRPKISGADLVTGLIFHSLAGVGSFAYHMAQLTGKAISDSALSQRRALLPWQVFECILEEALVPKANKTKNPEAFYKGLRLCGLDGTNFSIANSPQIKASMDKATSRRMKAAFAKVGAAVLVELGIHNPIAAAVGAQNESEMALAVQLLDRVPEDGLLIADRYYGVPSVLVQFLESHAEQRAQFLVRVRSNVKSRVIEAFGDGSALVELQSEDKRIVVREIVGSVRRGRGSWSAVRLWTSLVDAGKYPAGELMELYGKRWEQEGFYRELKVDVRSAERLQSHTQLTAMQEIAALVIGYALLVDERLKVAKEEAVPVLRISFQKTLQTLRTLWHFLELTQGMLSGTQVRKVVRQSMREIAAFAIPKRRQRSCPRALRQPVSSWPRLTKNTQIKTATQVSITPLTLSIP